MSESVTLLVQRQAEERDERIKQWEEFRVVSASKKKNRKVSNVHVACLVCTYNCTMLLNQVKPNTNFTLSLSLPG